MSGNLAVKLKSLIDKNHMSVQGLEKKAGLKINAVRNILTGHSKKPSADTLLAVAKALNCGIGELLGEEPLSNDTPSPFNDFEYSNLDLLQKCSTFVIQNFINQKKKLLAEKYINLIQEIYLYSIANNNAEFDEKFASWVIKKQF